MPETRGSTEAGVIIDMPGGRAVVVGPYDERKIVRFNFINRHSKSGNGDSWAELIVYFCGVAVLHKEDRKFDNAKLDGEYSFILEKGATASVCFVTRNSGAREGETSFRITAVSAP
jgi:hypothetical protein